MNSFEYFAIGTVWEGSANIYYWMKLSNNEVAAIAFHGGAYTIYCIDPKGDITFTNRIKQTSFEVGSYLDQFVNTKPLPFKPEEFKRITGQELHIKVKTEDLCNICGRKYEYFR